MGDSLLVLFMICIGIFRCIFAFQKDRHDQVEDLSILDSDIATAVAVFCFIANDGQLRFYPFWDLQKWEPFYIIFLLSKAVIKNSIRC